jgi:hypothetical protein
MELLQLADSIPIGKNRDRSGFADSALLHGKIDRAHRLGTSIAHEGKTGGIPAFPSPWSTLPATTSKLRSGRWCRFLTYPPSKPTTNFLAGSVDEEEASTSADFCSRLPTFIVRLRTVLGVVWEDKGKSSPRKSATFPNGNNAAILAVRYLNSGLVGFLLVKSVEKLRASDPEQEHPLSRRIRMPIFP